MMKSSESNGHLPEEIVLKILLRLPVKSLSRFMCVSTLWRSIINDPGFKSSHFAQSSTRPKMLVSVGERSQETGINGKFFLITDCIRNSDSNALGLVGAYHGWLPTTGHYISQSVGGFVCIDAGEVIQVCNPSTTECITFPKPPTSAAIRYSKSFLGYDPVEKKHKILNMARLMESSMASLNILTLGDKEWSRSNRGPVDIDLWESLCIDGVMHMVGVTGCGQAYLILFDVRLEKFQAIRFPGHLTNNYVCLIEFGGRVALLDYMFVLNELKGFVATISLWILEDLSMQVWSRKKFPISPRLWDAFSGERHRCVGVTHMGELVFAPLLSREPLHLYFYGFENATLRRLELSGLRQYLYTHGLMVCSHVESLQSLRGFLVDQ